MCVCVRVCVLVVGCGVASEEEGSVLACSCAVAWVPGRQVGKAILRETLRFAWHRRRDCWHLRWRAWCTSILGRAIREGVGVGGELEGGGSQGGKAGGVGERGGRWCRPL